MDLDLIDKKIKSVNKKSVIIGLLGAILAGFIAYPFGPTSDLLFLIGWIGLFSMFAFAITYKSSFYFFGKNLIDEAKQRGKYLVRGSVPEQSASIGDELMYDVTYKSLSGNIYHRD